MALPRGDYQDPCKWLIEKQSRSCKGCLHAKNLILMNKTYELCSLGKPYGKKCKQYREAK